MIEHVAHAPEGPGSSLGSAGAGWAGEIVCLPSLVCLKDILGIGQVPFVKLDLRVGRCPYTLFTSNDGRGKGPG